VRLVVVGCGTVVPEADRGGSCYYVEHGPVRALLDCGPGAVQAMARLGLPWDRLTHLFFTHFHPDHVGALPGLFFGLRHGIHPPRTVEPLEVVGPLGTRSLLRNLAGALGDFFLDPGFPVSVRDVTPGGAFECGPLRVATHEVPHTAESIAIRVEAAETGASLVYTGDTGPDEDLATFARRPDVLLVECSLPDDLVGDNHLSPSRVARLASRCAARRVVATHVYPQFRLAADVARLIREAGYEGPVELAREGLEIQL